MRCMTCEAGDAEYKLEGSSKIEVSSVLKSLSLHSAIFCLSSPYRIEHMDTRDEEMRLQIFER